MDQGVQIINEVVFIVFHHVGVENSDFALKIRKVVDLLVEVFFAQFFLLLVVIFQDFVHIFLNLFFFLLQDFCQDLQVGGFDEPFASVFHSEGFLPFKQSIKVAPQLSTPFGDDSHQSGILKFQVSLFD